MSKTVDKHEKRAGELESIVDNIDTAGWVFGVEDQIRKAYVLGQRHASESFKQVGFTRASFISALLDAANRYTNECERQDGTSYWSNFSTYNELLRDYLAYEVSNASAREALESTNDKEEKQP